VGGSATDFEAARPLLACMGKNIVHCGASGNGQVAKICNNLMLAIEMIATAEGMSLAAALGMDPKVFAGIVNTSSGRCWSSDTYNPYPGVLANVPASRDYSGGFGADLMLKDLGLATDAAKAVRTPVLMAALAQQGIQSSIHYPPVHLFTYYRSLWADGHNHRLPLTEQLASRLVTLPLYPSLPMAQMDTVVAAIYAYFR